MSDSRTDTHAPSLPPLTGFLLSNDERRSNLDSALFGWVRVGGVTYKVNVFGPQSHRGTTRRRYTVRLTMPLEDAMHGGAASRGDR